MDENIKKLFEINPKNIPSSIPIFPLDNVLLLPFGKLPLNIFEERYIKMTLDSLKSHRMIGIIQPKNNNNELFQMGCIGKITSYIETSDYRLVLNLEGVCRFVLNERNITPGGYYQASINCDDYLNDILDVEPHIDRNSLIQKYSNYFLKHITTKRNKIYKGKECVVFSFSVDNVIIKKMIFENNKGRAGKLIKTITKLKSIKSL